MANNHDLGFGCEICAKDLGFDFTFAFQPIVDLQNSCIFAHEALVRGLDGQGAQSVLKLINEDNRYRFDQECRTKSITLAKKLGIKEKLSINFMSNAVYKPELCIRTTLEAAKSCGFDISKIIFEVLESEEVLYPDKVKEIFQYYKNIGLLTAIDDFGSGYAGLTLLSEFKPDLIKIDIQLVRDITTNSTKQAIVRGVLQVAQELDIQVIAEGIEKQEEAEWFASKGVLLQQGYYYAKPRFQGLVSAEEIFQR